MTHGNKRDYRKIDIYGKRPHGLQYLASTTWARNCKEAREHFALGSGWAASDLVAKYSA